MFEQQSKQELYQDTLCLSENLVICSSTRREKILTTDIQVVFRGLKFFTNAVIGQISGFRSGTTLY